MGLNMNLKTAMIEIKVKQAISKPNGANTETKSFTPEELVLIKVLDYPGKKINKKPFQSWRFWTVNHIEKGFIFTEDEVSQVTITGRPELKLVFENAPFEVVWK